MEDLITPERDKQTGVVSVRNASGYIIRAKEEHPLCIDVLFDMGIISQNQRNYGLQYIAIRSFSLRQLSYASNSVYEGGISREIVKDEQDETLLILIKRKTPECFKAVVKDFCESYLFCNRQYEVRGLIKRHGANLIQRAFESLGDVINTARDEAKTRKDTAG